MKEKEETKKWLKIVLIAIVVYWCLNNLGTLGNFLSTIIKILSPFIIGGIIAFILNIPMRFFERKLTKKKKKKKIARVISLILSIIIIVLIIALIINLILPKLIDIAQLLIDQLPFYTENIKNALGNVQIENIMENLNITQESINQEIINIATGFITSSISLVGNFVSAISTTVIAIIFAIYILMSKERLQKQFTKILFAYVKKEKVRKILGIARLTRNTFANFLTIQCLEAVILGTLCIIGMLILQIPYAVQIGVLIGVTALIPIVGAFIGAAIGAVLIASVDIMKVITFIIFIIILQQVEGNLIYPRVVGTSIGLPGIWVLVAVSVGASLFGIIGMLVAVPTFSVLYTILKVDVNKKLGEVKK